MTLLLAETLIHGRDFGADAAAGTLLGLAARTAFVSVYPNLATAAAFGLATAAALTMQAIVFLSKRSPDSDPIRF